MGGSKVSSKIEIIENLLTIHALSSRCDRCHVSHGIADAVSRLAIVRASVAIRTADRATAAPFRLLFSRPALYNHCKEVIS